MDNFFSKNLKVYKGFRYNDPIFDIKLRNNHLIYPRKIKNIKILLYMIITYKLKIICEK